MIVVYQHLIEIIRTLYFVKINLSLFILDELKETLPQSSKSIERCMLNEYFITLIILIILDVTCVEKRSEHTSPSILNEGLTINLL